MERTSNKEKLLLIAFSIFVTILILELSLRTSGMIIYSSQISGNSAGENQSDVRILCIGESTTARMNTFPRYSYPEQLEDILNRETGETRFSVFNEGVIGIEIESIYYNLPINLEKYEPDIVIAMIGINDILHIGHEDFDLTSVQNNDKARNLISELRTIKLIEWIWESIIHRNNGTDSKVAIETGEETRQLLDDYKNCMEGEILDTGKCIILGYKLFDIDPEKSENLMRKAIEMDPDSSFVYDSIANIKIRMKEYDSAMYFINKSYEISNDTLILNHNLARYHIEKKDFGKAEYYLKEIILINPESVFAYDMLGHIYFCQNEFKKAEEAYLRLKEIQPEQRHIDDELVKVYLMMGKPENAKDYMNGDGHERVIYYYNRIYELLKQKGITAIFMQYPLRDVESLKSYFSDQEDIVFVSNKESFEEALKDRDYNDLFDDRFAGDFGHASAVGNSIIAENAAHAVLYELGLK